MPNTNELLPNMLANSATTIPNSDVTAKPEKEPPPETGVTANLGSGRFTLADGEAKGLVVDAPDSIDALAPEAIAKTLWQIEKIETREQLRTSLSLSASASADFGAMGGGASLSLYRESQFDEYTLAILASCSVVTNALRIPLDRQIADTKMLADLKEGKRSAFYRKYGNRYVDGYVSGGQILVYLSFRTQTLREYEATSAAIDGSSGKFSASVDFHQAFERIRNLSVEQSRMVIQGKLMPIPTWTDLDKTLREFPISIGAGTPMFFSTKALETLIDWPITDELRLIDEEERLRAIEADAIRLGIAKSRWERIGRSRGAFKHVTEAHVKKQIEIATQKSERLRVEAQKLIADAGSGPFPPREAFDFNAMETYPELRETRRPAIIGYLGPTTETTNGWSGNNGNVEDQNQNWIRSRSGNAASFGEGGAKLVGDDVGLELWMRLRGGVGDKFVDSDPEPALGAAKTPNGHVLTGLAFELRGPMAGFYHIAYQIHANEVGDSAIYGTVEGAAGPPGTIAANGQYPVQGFRLVIWPQT